MKHLLLMILVLSPALALSGLRPPKPKPPTIVELLEKAGYSAASQIQLVKQDLGILQADPVNYHETSIWGKKGLHIGRYIPSDYSQHPSDLRAGLYYKATVYLAYRLAEAKHDVSELIPILRKVEDLVFDKNSPPELRAIRPGTGRQDIRKRRLWIELIQIHHFEYDRERFIQTLLQFVYKGRKFWTIDYQDGGGMPAPFGPYLERRFAELGDPRLCEALDHFPESRVELERPLCHLILKHGGINEAAASEALDYPMDRMRAWGIGQVYKLELSQYYQKAIDIIERGAALDPHPKADMWLARKYLAKILQNRLEGKGDKD